MTNDERDKAIKETHTAVTQMLERWKMVDALVETVYGNGRDGLKTRVGKHDQAIRVTGVVLLAILVAALGRAFSWF